MSHIVRIANVATLALSLYGALPLLAQETTSETRFGQYEMPVLRGDSVSGREISKPVSPWTTAAELSYSVGLYTSRLQGETTDGLRIASEDSIRNAVAERATVWLTQLNRSLVRGIQLDPMGQLFVAAGDETRAIAQFDERLATPGLSLADQAYTYQAATWAFHDLDRPERLTVARRYLDRLLAMPVDVVGRWQFTTLAGITKQYFRRGRSREVIAWASRAMDLVPHLPFLDLRAVYSSGIYVPFADALAGTPGGRARIDTLNTQLLAATIPPAALVADDSAYVWIGESWAQRFKLDMAMTANLGQPAAPLVAHRWLNTTRGGVDTTSWSPTRVALNDGIIRLIEFGDRYCQYCMKALPAMNRLHHEFARRKVEVWFVTHTFGVWNTTFIDRAEEVDRLKEFYRVDKHATLPIALWAGEKRATDDDGMLPEESPNSLAYHITGTPTFYLIDGNGQVRHISRGFSDQEDERRLRECIIRLLDERASQPAVL